jgi:hypothetical protein
MKDGSGPDSGSLDSCVDCTYVLIMEGSKRESLIKDQVKRAGITSRIILQYNPGYKKCNKNLIDNRANYDLEHALKNVFRHALNEGYERILVLEDDCEFDERIKNPEILNDIQEFIMNNNPSIYSLGSFFHIPNPIDVIMGSKSQLLLFNASSHAVIYDRRFMEWLCVNNSLLGLVDIETNRHMSKYIYKTQLACQKIEKTQNSQEGWGWAYPLAEKLLIRPFNLDRQVQPGYDRIKVLVNIIAIIIAIVFIRSVRILLL